MKTGRITIGTYAVFMLFTIALLIPPTAPAEGKEAASSMG
jgi:hypothetical protein